MLYLKYIKEQPNWMLLILVLLNLHLEWMVECVDIDDLVKLIAKMTKEEFNTLINTLKLDPKMYLLVEFLEDVQRN